MSNEARHWAWSLPDLPTPVRLLLVALAEHVREGATTCFPGQARLAALCSVSERQVRNLLRELRVRGLISVEHRAGQGGGRSSNRYRLAMGERKPAADCPGGYPEAGFRNGGSGCDQATGNPVPGNRNSGAGNRNGAAAESEEGIIRKKLRETPPYPPKGGNVTHGHEDCSASPQAGRDRPASTTPAANPCEASRREPAAGTGMELTASAGEQGRAPLPRQDADPPSGRQRSARRSNTRRGKRSGQDQRLADKDYTIGATRDEDLPDWASAWRDRAPDEN
jgi:hypothetical protein